MTNWNCCSLSIKGQLQRAIPNPSPNVGHWPLLFPLKSNSPQPDVNLSPKFAFGIPTSVMGGFPSSGLCVIGLYLKYPKRKSASNVGLKVLVTPVAKLWL